VANKKISELTAATTPAETDVMPIVQSATTKKATVSAWVRGALLTGLSTATNTAIAATDSVLVALGKLQAQITGHIGNTTSAHGMTTTGAAIVQAATVADQRAAMGLENHEKVDVDADGRVKIGIVTTDGVSKIEIEGSGRFTDKIIVGGVATSRIAFSTDIGVYSYGIVPIDLSTVSGIDISMCGLDALTPNAAVYRLSVASAVGGAIQVAKLKNEIVSNDVLILKSGAQHYLAVKKGQTNGAALWCIDLLSVNINLPPLSVSCAPDLSGYSVVATI